MRGGRLDRLIDIQRKTDAETPSGGTSESWTNVVSRRPASMSPVRGDERLQGPEVTATEQVEFWIRFSENVADLSPHDRIVYPALGLGDSVISPTRIYDILAVPELGRREGLRIIAQRRPDALP